MTGGGADGSHESTIGVVSDIHYTPKCDDGVEESIRHCTTRFEDADIDRVLILGDLIMEGESPERDVSRIETVLDWFGSLTCPVTVLAGNHDVVNLSTERFAAVTGQERTYGSFDLTSDVRGVWLDSSAPQYSDARGEIPQEQMDFLDDELAGASNAIVFTHHPIHFNDLSENDWFSMRPEWAFCSNKATFTEIASRHRNVIATFNGHTHLRKRATYNGAEHVTVNAFNRERPGWDSATGLHALVDVSSARVRVRHYREDGDAPVEDWSIVQD